MILFLLATITNPIIPIGVNPINEISVETLSSSISIPIYPSQTTIKSSYAITTNGDSKKIIAAINPALPSNLVVCLSLQAPLGATSLGSIKLSPQGSLVVSGISRVAQNNLTMTYTFSSLAPVIGGNYSQLVKITLID